MTTHTLTLPPHESPAKKAYLYSKPINLGAPDWFRLAAAVLVIAIHTSPLKGINEAADLFLTGVAARIAVPFFFAVSGCFAELSTASGLKRLASGITLIYAAATALYLPFGTYNANFKSILFDGTFYHLWYFPACVMGAAIVYALKKLPLPTAFSIAALLYIIGLFGDSYYNIIADIEPLRKLYSECSKVFSYTRNGVFAAPIFMLYGNVLFDRPPIKRVFAVSGLAASAALFTAERFLLRGITFAPHDNLFIFLVPSTFFLMQLLISIKARPRPFIRTMSMWIYIIHPIIIDYTRKRGIEDPLQLALTVTAISLPIAAVDAVFSSKLKAIRRQRKNNSLDIDR